MKLPIRIRLAAAYCAVFCFMMAALEAVAYCSVRAAIQSIVDHELDTRLTGLDDHLNRHITRMSWPELRDSLKQHAAFQPDLLFVRRSGAETMFEGVPMRGLIGKVYGAAPSLATISSTGRVLRVLTVRRRIQGAEYDLALATDLFFPSAILSRLWLLMLISLPAVVLISLVAGYWIAGRAFAPVTGMIAAAHNIDSTRLSQRLAVPNSGDEIQQLAQTMNGMLDRIEDGFRQVRQFTSNASHELRTPLSIIRASAEVGLLGRGEKPLRDSLTRILREAERNTTVLENLLQLARADASADEPQKAPVDLAKNLAQACTDVKPLIESRGLHLRTAFGPDCFIEADAIFLHRLWIILLDNAAKYTPSGAITVTAAAENGIIRCSIADTGIGIAPEHLNRIFERFYRADKARSREVGGAGLGLAIARQIADLHHATLTVASEPGAGSTFTVSFQALPEQVGAPAPIASQFFR